MKKVVVFKDQPNALLMKHLIKSMGGKDLRFWVYFLRWFMINKSVLICFVEKYRDELIKPAIPAKVERDKSA